MSSCHRSANDGDEVLRVKAVQRKIVALGRRSSSMATDVTLGQGVQVMVRQVAKELGGIDILINAPDLFVGKPADATTDMEFNRVMQVNLAGTFHACRAVGKEMLKQATGGRIINVSSVLGERAIANAAAYCAAQAGVLNLTRALATEWGPSGITVNAIAQGWMQHTAAIGNPDPAANQTVRFVPMKRAGLADELGPLAVYLASDSCGYISGQVMFVDGGLSICTCSPATLKGATRRRHRCRRRTRGQTVASLPVQNCLTTGIRALLCVA